MRRQHTTSGSVKVLVANPSADVYGSDLQLLESVNALVENGDDVWVLTPDDGPLIARLRERGATTGQLRYPVVRRRNASPLGMIELILTAGAAVPRMLRAIRRIRPDLIYVNTMTIPWWILVGRLTRTPVVVHVHEAEADDPRPVRLGLNAPLKLANKVVVNSATSLTAMTDTIPSLADRAVMVHNGIDGPTSPPTYLPEVRSTYRVAVVGRLSPRKATDVALRAVAQLRSEGTDLVVDLAGTAFAGYEWYVDELRALAGTPALEGSVNFLGYVDPIWEVLAGADVVLAPSTRESLGNAVIEAQLAQRPVIATATSGHFESVDDGENGLLVPVNDVDALAVAIRKVLTDRDLAARLASAGRVSALQRFSPERYRREIVDLVSQLVRRR